MTLDFYVPILPRTVLSTSGGPPKPRDEVAEAVLELASEVLHVLPGRPPPRFEGEVVVAVAYRVGGRRKDGRYRPESPVDAVSALRPLFRALLDAGVIPSYAGVTLVVRIEPVARDEEGLHVRVWEVT